MACPPLPGMIRLFATRTRRTPPISGQRIQTSSPTSESQNQCCFHGRGPAPLRRVRQTHRTNQDHFPTSMLALPDSRLCQVPRAIGHSSLPRLHLWTADLRVGALADQTATLHLLRLCQPLRRRRLTGLPRLLNPEAGVRWYCRCLRDLTDHHHCTGAEGPARALRLH